MGGGGQGQGMPTSGGMTVYNQLGYDPSQPQGGTGATDLFLSALGSGMKAGGKALASSGYKGGVSSVSGQGASIPDQPSGNYTIPQNNLVEALLRLLGQG